MEQQEMGAQPQKNELVIDLTIKDFLNETAKWGKFLSIVGFIFCGIIVLAGIFMMFMGSVMFSNVPGMGMVGSFFGGFMGFIYLLMALVYYFPSKYLYDFSIYTKQAILIDDQESMVYAFSKLKSLFRFWGILIIIVLALYAIIILFGIIVGIFAATLA